MPPPGGPMQPGQMPPPGAPGPYQVTGVAAPQKESSATKYIVIGCVVLLLVGLIGGGIAVYFGAKKGLELSGELAEDFKAELEQGLEETMGGEMDAAMEEMKTTYLQLVSKGHKKSRRERFENMLDQVLIQERKRLGSMKWAMAYQGLMNDLGTMSEDGTITVKESRGWCDKAEAAIAENSE